MSNSDEGRSEEETAPVILLYTSPKMHSVKHDACLQNMNTLEPFM